MSPPSATASSMAGVTYAAPVRIDDEVMPALEALVPLAPLHQPHALAAIRAVAARPRRTCPRSPASTLPSIAASRRSRRLFAMPRALTDEGVRRYGFHGISYEYIASVLPRLPGDRRRARGGRASRQRRQHVRDAAGRSVATTMGFTALDGLPMGTRSGALDPACCSICSSSAA